MVPAGPGKMRHMIKWKAFCVQHRQHLERFFPDAEHKEKDTNTKLKAKLSGLPSECFNPDTYIRCTYDGVTKRGRFSVFNMAEIISSLANFAFTDNCVDDEDLGSVVVRQGQHANGFVSPGPRGPCF